MRRIVALVLLITACGSATPRAENAEPTTPMTMDELRAAWVPLAREEATLNGDLTLLPTLGSEEKTRRLTRMRQSAGFIAAGLARLRPPEVLVTCAKSGVDAAKAAQATLDQINDVWMGRAAGGRANAEQLSNELCDALFSLAAARQGCGVKEPVAPATVCNGP